MDKIDQIKQGSRVFTNDDYKELWTKSGPIQIKMVEQIGLCRHNLGDTFTYSNPYEKPQGICTALLHVLGLYTWRDHRSQTIGQFTGCIVHQERFTQKIFSSQSDGGLHWLS